MSEGGKGAADMKEHEPTPVLLVDDHPENLIAMQAVLDGMGLEFFKAASGNEALSLTLKHDFAIVLMDVRMPEMDGFEAAELMRTHPKTTNLPIIFVTGELKDTEHQFKGYETGAFDYLLKPIEPTILRSKVRVFAQLYKQRRIIEHHTLHLELLVKELTVQLLAANEKLLFELEERRRAEEQVRQLNEELEQRVRERTKELEHRNYELEQMNSVFIGRELRMVELKERIRELTGDGSDNRGSDGKFSS